MTRPIALTVALAGALAVSINGQTEPPLLTAHFAWERGDYVDALTTYLRVLDSPDADAALETVALQTGELFNTVELTPDGAAPVFAPDGRHFTYETGTAAARKVQVRATAHPLAPLAELNGSGAAFSPDGRSLAYLQLTPTPDLEAELTEANRLEGAARTQGIVALNQRIALASRIVVRDLASGAERTVDAGPLRKAALAMTAGGAVVFAGTPEEGPRQIYSAAPGAAPVALTSGDGDKTPVGMNSTGTALLYTIRTSGAGRGGGGPAGGADTRASFGLLPFPAGAPVVLTGSAPAFSADGRSFTFLTRDGAQNRVMAASVDAPAAAAVVRATTDRVEAPALSADGSRVVFQMMPKEDWELFVVNRDGTGEARLTREIQHDVLPRFLAADRILGMVGEARHRRSYVHDVQTGRRVRLFHNNTVRTIAPEYAWVPSPDGSRVLIVAERDGDTVSLARGVYLVDMTRRVTLDELRARLRASLAAEQALRARGTKVFAPIADAVRSVVGAAAVERVFAYGKALFDFDSKHISQPGNARAAEYLFNTYKSFGYEPEYQWFEARNALGGRTANVLATLRGTLHPELVYVVSSHYDSVAVGPGADDDSSGTAALLETARILARHPQPATIVFASFTGEEAGLLGSREWVRQAVASKMRLVGALNNDMIGWANDQRLDNTIRYSNAGIRDIQHAAAMQFTNLITYDALYYKSTDAAAYYEAYGDIVGGIGSYPVLGNPHYHQPHDLLDTINHRLVTEVAKTTAATLMLLASSPSRLSDLAVTSGSDGTATVRWMASPEKDVTGYVVMYGPPSNPDAQQMNVTAPAATLKGLAPGWIVSVKAINRKGLEGWDWARTTVTP